MSLYSIYRARQALALVTSTAFLSSVLTTGPALAQADPSPPGGPPPPAAPPAATEAVQPPEAAQPEPAAPEELDGPPPGSGDRNDDTARADVDSDEDAQRRVLGELGGDGSDSADPGGAAIVADGVLPQGEAKSGVTSQAISMPKGEGTVTGMGESFSTQLSTGVATFRVPFKLPAARGNAQPSLGLSYSSGGGFGLAGVGWSMSVPFIARQTDRGVPSYDDRDGWHPGQDRFVFNGGQELIPICVVAAGGGCEPGPDGSPVALPDGEVIPAWFEGWQYFRPRVEGVFMRFFWSPDHDTWRIQSKTGVTMELGAPLDTVMGVPAGAQQNAIETNPNNSEEKYRWHLVRQYDTYGGANPVTSGMPPTPVNVVQYLYVTDGDHLYLKHIFDTPAPGEVDDLSTYAHHTELSYETRTDPTISYRSGWRIEQNLRLSRVDVRSKPFLKGITEPRDLVRSYRLDYDTTRHISLLESVQVEGREGGALPPMRFRYSHVGPDPTARFGTYEPFNETVENLSPSPKHSIDEQLTDFFDIDSDALPDVVTTAPALFGGNHGVWFNGGPSPSNLGFTADAMGVLADEGDATDSNILKLSNRNVNPLDLDADGEINLVHMPRVKKYSLFQPERIGNEWFWLGRNVETASSQDPKIDFANNAENIRVMDVNYDGLVDIVATTGTEMQTFFSLGRYKGGDGQFGRIEWFDGGPQDFDIRNEPVTSCLPWSGQVVRFSDADIHIADMNADSIPDIVRVRPGDIRYWPGRGNGYWGTGDRADCTSGEVAQDRHIVMSDSPQYQVVQGDSLLVDDVNGDGLSDLVEVRFNNVDIYLNVDGRGWTPRHVMFGTPPNPESRDRVRLVDINGSGTRDIVWGDGLDYKYIDLQGGTRPWLLTGVANGLGKTTSIEYQSSTEQMLAAEAAGNAWSSTMPMVTHVVSAVEESGNLVVAGRPPGSYRTEYTYRDPLYDGRQREFRGFRKATARRIGDANSPTEVTETTFLLGECVDETPDPDFDQCAIENRWMDNPREALKGLPVLTEKRNEAGEYLSTKTMSYTLRPLYTGLDGREVRYAFESRTNTYLYDTGPFSPGEAAASASVVDVELGDCGSRPADACSHDLAFTLRSNDRAHIRQGSIVDEFGNRTEAIAYGCVEGCPDAPDEIITSFTVPGLVGGDPSGWLWRTQSSRVEGSEHAIVRNRTRTTYNARGDPTRVEAFLEGTLPLDRRDEALAATQPDRSSLGAGWIDVVSLREYDAFGNVTGEKAPNQRCRTVGYDDEYEQLPTVETIYTGGCPGAPSEQPSGQGNPLTTAAMYDRGFEVVTTFVDVRMQVTTTKYDEFARLKSMTRPDTAAGDSCARPSILVDYFLPELRPLGSNETPATLPLSELYTAQHSVIRTQTQDGASCDDNEYLVSALYIDGFGRNIVTLNEADPSAQGGDDAAWIASELLEYDDKGAVRRKYLDFFWDGTDPLHFDPAVVPDAAYGRQRYDAFARQVQTFDLDGTVTLQSIHHELSVDLFDAADLQPGPHQGTPATERRDGHGRIVETIERFDAGGVREERKTLTRYLPTDEPERIARVQGSSGDVNQVIRWFRYDSLGRMVLNVEPNTSVGFQDLLGETEAIPESLKAWRYAYNDFGDLVGASDARTCGINYFYDGAGRVLMEDYFPCESHHAPYSEPDLSATGSPSGMEVLYEYDDVPDIVGTSAGPAHLTLNGSLAKGQLVRVRDRASDLLFSYDARGRQAAEAKRIAEPGPTPDALGDRYTAQWFERDYDYDALDRPLRETTGVPEDDGTTPSEHVIPELLADEPGAEGTSAVTYQYSRRGTLNAVGSSYGPLVTTIERTADELTKEIVYGDVARTRTSSLYDERRRLMSVQTYRGPPASFPPDFESSAPTTFQLLLQDESFVYDVVNNPLEIHDWRIPEEWPDGAKPVTKKLQYDDLYRVTRVDYQYPGGDDDWVSPYAEENAEAGDTAPDDLGELRRAHPSPHVSFDKRVQWQEYQYDWLGNTERTDDDARGFYDRSLGDVDNGDLDDGPYQLRGASNGLTGERSGALQTRYDAAGNLTRLLVQRNGPCLPAGADCSQWFEYQRDEVGRLVRAQRWDGETEPPVSSGDDPPPPPAGPAAADLAYEYDANDQRVIKTATDPAGISRHTLYVFASLELRRAPFSDTDQAYEVSRQTVVPYLLANGVRLARLVYEEVYPFLGGGQLHVFFELGNHLGSTSVVLDKATSELVERSTYQAYGAAESDYRPDRWEGFREDYRFTGKEEDVEVGLVYFGKRFYAPLLGRWVSADPLTVHALEANANVYAYVSGSPLRNVDPLGLEEVTTAADTGIPPPVDASGQPIQPTPDPEPIVLDEVKIVGTAPREPSVTTELVRIASGGTAVRSFPAPAAVPPELAHHIEETNRAAANASAQGQTAVTGAVGGGAAAALGAVALAPSASTVIAETQIVVATKAPTATNVATQTAAALSESPVVAAGAGVGAGVAAARGVPNLVRHGPLNPGPLPAAIANTFRGGSYTANTVAEATTLYRVYGGKAGQIGGYWTRTKPSGPIQSIIDSALNPQWGNTATSVATIRVPAGTTIYEGAAAAQGGLVGGGSQVFIPSVNPAWLVP